MSGLVILFLSVLIVANRTADTPDALVVVGLVGAAIGTAMCLVDAYRRGWLDR